MESPSGKVQRFCVGEHCEKYRNIIRAITINWSNENNPVLPQQAEIIFSGW